MKLFHLARPVCILPRVLAPAHTKSRARALRAGSERVASFFGRRESSRHRNRFAALSGSTDGALSPFAIRIPASLIPYSGPFSYRVQRPFQPRNKRVESSVHLSQHLEFRSNCCPKINRSIFVKARTAGEAKVVCKRFPPSPPSLLIASAPIFLIMKIIFSSPPLGGMEVEWTKQAPVTRPRLIVALWVHDSTFDFVREREGGEHSSNNHPGMEGGTRLAIRNAIAIN